MSVFKNKNIILGVCGGIAAYKSVALVRLLRKQGAQVQVVMTRAATEFVTAITFQAISARPVRGDLFDQDAEAAMGHIELSRWADLIIIAPATANTIAKIACGLADNLLTTICLATGRPLLIAPAMNQQMWSNEATQNNIGLLSQRKNISFCGPAEGEQACGDNGAGRMVEPEDLLDYCAVRLTVQVTTEKSANYPLSGRRVLITAGPTIEDIDPVRYLSNRSSGKMGYAIAQAAREQGAEVFLVSGPVALQPAAGIRLISVRSARQMHEAVFAAINDMDVFIATAAVADYRPVEKVNSKIKKTADELTIQLIKNPDILADVAVLADKPLTIGFAAETHDIKKYALDKLSRKNLDMIVANEVGEEKGFEVDHNELHLFWRNTNNNKEYHKEQKQMYKKLAYADKHHLARQLITEITLMLRSIEGVGVNN